ncbi:MAG TPA: hydrogenase maturation protease [Candidatus Sulfotelmatobacter sp.]|nr:hydrogenase maturation protease [Candidatus Sulfotelmatobacter sp.]
MPPRILIVAYGNPLRSDDGVAWRAADLLAQKFSESKAEILCLHQLAPELSETASHFATVIFIDAAAVEDKTVPGQIHLQEIAPQARADPSRFTHAISPETVLALAAALYGAKPQAFLVTVTAASFDHGDALSPSVEAALPTVVSEIERLVEHTFLKS